MASPIKQVSMKCIVMILLLLLLFSSTRGQQIHGGDGQTLLMMNIIDTLDTLSLQLKEHEGKMEAKLEEQERTLEAKVEALLEGHEVKMEAKLEEQGKNLDAKMKVLLEGHEVKMEAKLEVLQQQCSTRDQVSEFQDLLATDECQEGRHNCSEMATCVDHRINYSCTCLPGYSGDGFTCEDVDECSQKKEVCSVDQICQNIPGTYTCLCPEGFEKEGDICRDVDECSENIDTCGVNEVCINNPGSFTCRCPKYFKKVGDICQVPVCESPSVWIPSLGCLTVVTEKMNWDDGKSKCQDLGMRLAEGIRRQHMESLAQHFDPTIKGEWPFIGLRNGRWLTSEEEEEEVSLEDWREGDPDGNGEECGQVDMHPSVMGLADYLCSGASYVMCQSLP